MNQPYISIVVVARHDNHGGDFLCRINAFVRNIVVLSEKHCLPCELVIVEWNPPRDQPRLKNVISWPDIHRKFIQIRIIEVPGEVHQMLPNPERLHLFEFIGKNVGIRRARADYILTTNADVLFNDNLITFFALRRLRPGRFYRIDRCDVQMPLPVDTVGKQLHYCHENIIHVHGYFWSLHDRKNGGMFRRCRQMKAFAAYAVRRICMFPSTPPHCNAAGDFLLLHRNDWESIQGFPELETEGAAHHIDTLAVHRACAAGVRQIIMKYPLRLYHQDHGRLDPHKPMSPSVRAALDEVGRAKRTGYAMTHNVTWGLAQEKLPDASIV